MRALSLLKAGAALILQALQLPSSTAKAAKQLLHWKEWTRAVLCDDMYHATTQKNLWRFIPSSIIFSVLQIRLFMATFFGIWTMLCVLPHSKDAARKIAWRQHKQIWKIVNTKRGNSEQEKDSDQDKLIRGGYFCRMDMSCIKFKI